ncbi:sulfotransferase domain-containing protein [Longimicrobium sp.]|uniref:sulfotransferase domain-containing protein n=1 Tax=Longimicrobium sp. TaxID=2029185 RepID=UPI003B3BB038
MRLPDLVIAGAPKCGTSSLFRWLAAHPAVRGSSVKETYFLLDRGHPLQDPARNVHDHGLAAYASFFPDAAGDDPSALLLEGTTHYLYQQTAPHVLGGMDRPPHVIFLLREPAERVYSSYRYTRNNLGVLRPGATFRDFLGLGEGGDASALTDPRWGGKVDIWRNDVGYSRYAEHLARWAEVFPRERMHVFLAENLWRDPRALLRGLAQRVGIDPAFYDDFAFARHNESYAVRSPALHRLARRAGAVLPRGGLRALLRKGYMGVLASGRAERTDDDAAALRELRASYAPHNARLAREWGLDLGAWEARPARDAVVKSA